MTLIKLNRHLHPVGNFGNFFDDFFGNIEGVDFKKSHLPPVNIRENDDNFILELGVPGVKKDDISIRVDEDVLTISSENKEERNEQGENFTRKEFSYSSFSRSFTLPEGAQLDNIKADYVDGILKITVPKMVEAKTKEVREIKVS